MNELVALPEIEAHAVSIAGKAGEILLSHLSQPVDVQFKGRGSKDPVTDADRQSDEYLKAAIREKFPEHGILSEEGDSTTSESPFAWVLDPLDGTVNFMNGLPLFAVSVAVLFDRQPVVGAIFAPVTHKAAAGVYHGRLGNGAWLNNERIDMARPSSGRPLAVLPPGSRFHLAGRSRKEPHETRSTGSIALDLAFAACGIFQYALFGRPRIWDVAAGVLLVKEAGGTASVMRRGEGWHPLDRFETVASQKHAPEGLHDWASPLVAGSFEAVSRVVRDVRGPGFRWPLLAWRGRP